MLVLSRRRGQAISIDGGIRIVVLHADRRGVRLGIEAPASTRIQREELEPAPQQCSTPPPAAQTARDKDYLPVKGASG